MVWVLIKALKMQFILWWYNVYSLHDICVLQQVWVGCRLARCDNQDLGNYCDMDEEQWIVSHNAVYKGTWLNKHFNDCAFLKWLVQENKTYHSLYFLKIFLCMLYHCVIYKSDVMPRYPSMPRFADVMTVMWYNKSHL